MKYSFCLGQWSYVSKTVSLPVDTDSQSGGDGFGAMGAMGGGMGAAAMGTGMGLMGGMPMRQQGGCVLIVSNLEETRVTPDVLFTLFGVYGDVLRVKILFNKKDTALIQVTISFLDASSHLYMRVCPSVGPSIGASVRRSVRDAFVKNGKIDDFDRK